MKVEYSILILAVSFVYALVVKFLPDFPVDESVFQVGIMYLLIKLGVDVVEKPADALRSKASALVSKFKKAPVKKAKK